MVEICAMVCMVVMVGMFAVVVRTVGKMAISLTVKNEGSENSISEEIYDKDGNIIVTESDDFSVALDEAVKAVNAIMTDQEEMKND